MNPDLLTEAQLAELPVEALVAKVLGLRGDVDDIAEERDALVAVLREIAGVIGVPYVGAEGLAGAVRLALSERHAAHGGLAPTERRADALNELNTEWVEYMRNR